MYKVLLVEDEDIIRKGIRNAVPWEEAGCCVIAEAANGLEGKKFIEEMKPDIVITDINMPVMDGLKMIAETKCEYDYVAIILTGYSDFEYAREAIHYGVSNYVLKPMDTEEMKQTLEQAVLDVKNLQYLNQRDCKIEELKNINLLEEEENSYKDSVVTQVLEYIAKHYQEKILLSDLEEELHYSERYINQKFRKELNTTVIEYLNRFRIQKALLLLRENRISVSEIGWECGIGEYKYFNHVFKKYIGCTAREYQKRMI